MFFPIKKSFKMKFSHLLISRKYNNLVGAILLVKIKMLSMRSRRLFESCGLEKFPQDCQMLKSQTMSSLLKLVYSIPPT